MSNEFDPPDGRHNPWEGDEVETCEIDGATSDELDNLVHTLLTRRLVMILRDPNCTAGDIQAGLRFLKDNGIQALDVPGSATEALKKAVAARVPFKPKLTGTD